ncbi:MAG: hypothetical protein JW941_03070 [Candidatus Coatesbacteria bacterium]|nr:hypothetical protein [Candidatus Coatesbacteria bacterium]
MINGKGIWWSEAFAHIYVGLWGIGTVLILISFDRAIRRRRLIFRLGLIFLALGSGLGIFLDWDNSIRATMSVAALAFCLAAAAISLLKERIGRRRRMRMHKEEIEHLRDRDEDDE